MTDLVDLTSRRQKRSFVDFIYRVYAGNLCYRDTLIPVVELFLHGAIPSPPSRSFVPPDRNPRRDLGAVHARTYPLLPMMQVAFFDALPDRSAAVERLVDEARAEARRRASGASWRGSRASRVRRRLSRRRLRCPLLVRQHLHTRVLPRLLVEACGRRPHLVDLPIPSRRGKPAPAGRPACRRQVPFPQDDMRRFREETILLGELSNRCLRDTYLYFDRDPYASVPVAATDPSPAREQAPGLRLSRWKEVGFLFWHPDFNQLIPGGRRNSFLLSGIGASWERTASRNAKLNAVGIDPRYHGSSIAAGLVHELGGVLRRPLRKRRD